MDLSKPISTRRSEIYQTIEKTRKIRNRITHHEPIFYLNIPKKYDMIHQIINFRCEVTANWIREKDRLYPLIFTKVPKF